MKSVYKAFTPLLLLISSCGSGDQNSTVIQKVAPKVNYGYNIIVAVDLSNRILNNRHLQDPDVVKLITDNLKNIFQNSINVGINDKFYLTTINDEDFIEQSYSDSIFKIDLTRFKTDEVGRSNYLYHNDTGTNSLKYDIFKLNSTFASFYQAKKREKQLPADVWYFFQDKLTYPFIDTASQSYVFNDQPIVSKYKNYVILLTDGYIEAGRYKNDPDMLAKNKSRFLSQNLVNAFRSSFKDSKLSSITDYFNQKEYGIIPVNNPLLKDCKILVLEMYDRSYENGVSTKTPTDLEIMKLFWKDWLVKSGVSESDIKLNGTFNNSQDLNYVFKDFLGIR